MDRDVETGNSNSGITITGGSTVSAGAMAAGRESLAIGNEPAETHRPRPAAGAGPIDSTERTRKVFVVHGRDVEARTRIFNLIRRIDLHPLDWESIVRSTSTATPFLGEVVRTAFTVAHAVVVLLTPDDVAFLHPQLRDQNDPLFESQPTSQPRPNVLFEAGMALGMHPHRTVLVKMGSLRPFSDIDGRNFVRYNGSIDSFFKLASRLETAGCPVRMPTEFGDLMELAELDAYRRHP